MITLKADLTQLDLYSKKIWKYIHEQFERIIKDNGLKKTKKRSVITLSKDEKDFIIFLNNEDNIRKLLKVDVDNLKKTIKIFR